MKPASVFSALSAALLVSCVQGPKPTPPLELPEGCQPLLGGADCFLPYPSNFFLVDDASLPSGKRVEVGDAADIQSGLGGKIDVHTWRQSDGFSRIPVITAFLPEALSAEGLPGVLSPASASTTLASPTLLIDAVTGALVPHFVDIDPREVNPKRRALVIHPMVGLREKSRYIVVLQNIKTQDGELAKPAVGFAKLRDGNAAGEPALAPLETKYETEIFPMIQALGLRRGDLQLAWDFTTGSEAHVQGDMLRVRELTEDFLSTHTPVVTIDAVEEDANDPTIWRTIRGTVEGPLFLQSPVPGAELFYQDGQIAPNGLHTFKFTAKIPASVRDQQGPGGLMGFGHGFFGGQGEIDAGKTEDIANRVNNVTFAIDWIGMNTFDGVEVAQSLTSDPSVVMRFTDGVHQAMANWMVLTAAMQSSFQQEEAFHRPLTPGDPGTNPDGSNAGDLTYSDATLGFVGISQGHILGGTLAAINPDISRYVFNVGGAGFTHMMFRASPFAQFLTLMDTSIPSALDQQKFVATLQEQFDRVDPGSYAPLVLSRPLSGSPSDRRVMLQNGLGDAEVPNLGSFLHARQLGISLLTPTPFEVFGLPLVGSVLEGSAMVLYDFGVDLVAQYAVAEPPASNNNDVHEGLRRLDAALEQMRIFLQTGVIVHTCDGICDPE